MKTTRRIESVHNLQNCMIFLRIFAFGVYVAKKFKKNHTRNAKKKYRELVVGYIYVRVSSIYYINFVRFILV